ncbi:hypothetical protein KUH32_08355 [Thalassococcus sp. CAU 1522]|uniref:Uncharacterized protein n=1 Tax=Thalassococcus arenae TaxID=2851652 RepID=A0ABS6N6Y8_9RHOB|nr:hypothetical protein [Thalassococcus arenae]MBV2359783.1 hypothetical protein [Thalassococcus arenae]
MKRGWFEFIRSFPVGVMIGASIGIAYVFALESNWNEAVTEYVLYGLTALVTLGASAIALTTAIWDSESKRDRRLRAAKASLPMALSELMQVAERGIRLSLMDTAVLRDSETGPNVRAELAVSETSLATLKECIESADETSAKWLVNIVAHYQVYVSRIDGAATDRSLGRSEHNRQHDAANWILWASMVAHCFDFARGEDVIPETMDGEQLGHGFLMDLSGSRHHRGVLEEHNDLRARYAPLSAVALSFTR